jgi:CYTH domain-containing protein
MTMFLAEITVWDPRLGGTRVLRFSTGRGFVTQPTDTPANTYYAPRILQPCSVVRNSFSAGSTMGRSTVGYGDLVLLNGDGELDYMLELGLDGRNITLLRSSALQPRYSAFRPVLVATMQHAEFSGNTITIQLRDNQYAFDTPLQANKYAGDNILPDGVEGGEDLKGKPKPVCLGVVRNISPPCVNTSQLIYQVNDGAITSVDTVYDRGVPLVLNGTTPDFGEFLSTLISPGEYLVWTDGGMFRLASSPVGQVTADVTQGATAADRTAAQLFYALFQRAIVPNPWIGAAFSVTTGAGDSLVTNTGAFLETSRGIETGDLFTLDAFNSAELGFWTDNETTVAAVADLIADTVGAWWGTDRRGVFRIRQFGPADPSLTPVVTLGANDLLVPLQRFSTSDPGGGIPVYRQTVRYGRLYTVQANDLAGAVGDARRAELAQEWRDAIAEDTTIQAAHLLSPESVRTSLFAYEADAVAEAVRRLAMYGVRRDRFELVIALTDESDVLDFGSIVGINHARYSLNVQSTAISFVVLGLELDAKGERVTLTVWGSRPGYELATETNLALVSNSGSFLTANAQ